VTLNVSQPYRPSWPVTGIALLFFTFYWWEVHKEIDHWDDQDVGG
jgi:hypothetical protein